MANISKLERLAERDIAYFRQRQKNRVFSQIVAFFADEAEKRGITKRDLAVLLDRDPAQITRWLAYPSNLTLDSVSDLLLALGAELDHKVVRFAERASEGETHPLIADLIDAPGREAPAAVNAAR